MFNIYSAFRTPIGGIITALMLIGVIIIGSIELRRMVNYEQLIIESYNKLRVSSIVRRKDRLVP